MPSDIHSIMLQNYRLSSRSRSDSYSNVWSKPIFEGFGDVIRDEAAWVEFLGNGIGGGIGGDNSSNTTLRTLPEKVTDSNDLERLARSYRGLCRSAGQDLVDSLIEAEIGRPQFGIVDGKKVTQNDLRLVSNAYRIYEVLKNYSEGALIVEIGAGYGGLTQKLTKLLPKSRYVLIDLPEINAIQTWYLSQFVPMEELFLKTSEDRYGIQAFLDGSATIAILPTTSFSALPSGSVDMFINVNSLSEMNIDVMRNYIEGIQGKICIGGLFYCANRYIRANLSDVVSLIDYPWDNNWYATVSETSWLQSQIHELMLVRTQFPNTHSMNQLFFDYPPYSLKKINARIRRIVQELRILVRGGHVGTGNAGVLRWASGLSENPNDPIARTRRRVGGWRRRRRRSSGL